MSFNRREFLQASLKASLATLMAPSFLSLPFSLVNAGTENDPHFFLNIVCYGGLDLSYLIDARNMALHNANIKANYLGEDPKSHSFENGTKTLVTRLYEPLMNYQSHFSVIQGVHMSSTFDGHEQNMNLLLTGNPFGGELFIPHLNLAKLPLDTISNGPFIGATLNNDAKTVPLSSKTMADIKKSLTNALPLSSTSALYRALERNYRSSDFSGNGRMSLGTQALAKALVEQESLFTKFSTIPHAPQGQAEFVSFMNSAIELLKQGVTNSLNLTLNLPSDLITFDTHSADSAKNTEALMKFVVERLTQVMQILIDTPYDSRRSFMDVTTFMMSTEFGRTNRQVGLAMDKTGTDHNPFNNTIILGGKKIVTNRVIGASDLHTKDETLSQAHLSLDSSQMKIFGRPFDFSKQETSFTLPKIYSSNDYITIASVINTVYKIFDVPASSYRKNGRDAVPASTLDGLIS